MICHPGISFEQACEQLGLSQQEQQALDQLQQQQSQLALPLLDIMMYHPGISFEQACEQLGLSPLEQQTLSQLQEQDHPE
ncbi:hypothetical protein [Aeromonas jandaei]|uniref:hypothetical protein n=1 Tax=Aeromonas jandaei TaxID=650 RepID=UPI0038D148B8